MKATMPEMINNHLIGPIRIVSACVCVFGNKLKRIYVKFHLSPPLSE